MGDQQDQTGLTRSEFNYAGGQGRRLQDDTLASDLTEATMMMETQRAEEPTSSEVGNRRSLSEDSSCTGG